MYKVINEVSFHEEMSVDLIKVLQSLINDRECEVRIYYGDVFNGQIYSDFDSGYVGVEDGIPMIYSRDFTAYEITQSVVRILRVKDTAILYEHPRFKNPK